MVKGVCPVRCSCANRLCISFQDAQTALQQLKVPLQVSEQDAQVNRTHSKAAPASYFLPLRTKRNSLAGRYYLCMFELQLSELHQVLPERRNSSRLEVDEL